MGRRNARRMRHACNQAIVEHRLGRSEDAEERQQRPQAYNLGKGAEQHQHHDQQELLLPLAA
jgi:hypothetical protein